MGMKSRLFASAAFPLLSLSLVLPAAHVLAAAPSIEETRVAAQSADGSFEVAQDAPSDEELLKKQREQQEEQQKQAPAEAPKAPEPAAEAPPPPPAPKAEAPAEAPPPPPAAEPAPKAPEAPAEKPAAEAPAQQEAPAEKPRKQKQPAAEQQPDAAAPTAEQPAEKPRHSKRDKQPQQEEAAPPQPAEQAAPQVEQAAPQTEEQKPPRKNGKPAPADGAEQPAKPQKKPAAEAPKAEPEAQQPADAQPPAKPGEAPAQQQGEVAPAQPDGVPAGQPPVAQAEQPIPAPEKVTPQEIERRKEIAADPAKSTETVVLPVQNGAAVLDSDKDADRSGGVQSRRDRDKQRGAEQQVRVPKSDADAQLAAPGGAKPAPVKIEAITSEQGQRLDRRPQFARPDGASFGERGDDNRVIIQFNNQTYVRGDDDRRFLRDGERPVYEQLQRDRYRETIDRDGYQIVTVRNRYGDIIQRSRIDNRGREHVLYYTPDLSENPDRDYFEDPGADLPPMRLRIPLQDYIMDTSNDDDRDYYDFLREPPVEPVERVYSLNEVKYSARIRDKVRRIDLDTVTFATGSAEIPMSQARSMRKVADAINEVLKKDPTETFLIEGHTDAVGSDQSNLILSDQRAESVANVMSDVYGIPPENLATQGYGERYLKVNTQGPEQENRRVTIRRVTALVRPVASSK
ncbi:OmpA family protein [Rhizobium sp. 18055]|uniref:OmpA family protein n=1 Tax=Rhizobium sp. 18055 TaxID=2681403 RepID=UPI001358B5F8|nr:OmpA family protein [Rhizobium sp. 18055]